MKKKRTVDFNKVKVIKDIKRVAYRLRFLIALILVIVIAASAFSIAGETRRSNIQDSFRQVPTTFGLSKGYPYSEDELSLQSMTLVGDKPLLVTNNGVQVLSPDADVLYSLHLDWGDTKAVSNNGRALIYSNTSNKSYLISRTTELASFQNDGPTTTGCVGNNGSVAIVSTLDKVQSLVSVYSPKQKNIFAWECSKDYVTSVSLNSSGKKIAIAAIGAENAEIYSRVILFKTNGESPEFDVRIDDTAILKVVYASANKIIAIGDNKTIIYNSKGEVKEEIPYSEQALYSVDSDKKGNVLLCYKEFGGSKIKFTVIKPMGSTNKSFELEYNPTSVDISSGKISASVENKVTEYNFNGEIKDEYQCSNNVSTACLTSVGIYTVENGTICKY